MNAKPHRKETSLSTGTGSPRAKRCGCSCGCHYSDHGSGCRGKAKWLPKYKVWACDECLAFCDD